jgi:hypothetical protein
VAISNRQQAVAANVKDNPATAGFFTCLTSRPGCPRFAA